VGVDVTTSTVRRGEHGDSEVLIWSSLDVAGRPLQEFAEAMGRPWDPRGPGVHRGRGGERRVPDHPGKGATYYGVAAAIARVVDVLVRDRRSILTVSAWSPAYGCALSCRASCAVPASFGRSGCRSMRPSVERLERSAAVLREHAAPSATEGTHDALAGEDRLTAPAPPRGSPRFDLTRPARMSADGQGVARSAQAGPGRWRVP